MTWSGPSVQGPDDHDAYPESEDADDVLYVCPRGDYRKRISRDDIADGRIPSCPTHHVPLVPTDR